MSISNRDRGPGQSVSPRVWLCVGAVWAVLFGVTGQAQTGLGRGAESGEVAGWGAIVGPTGEGLPPGGATAAEGAAVYQRRCARCHGPTGTEGPDARLAGGRGSLASDSPQKTVGSYWPTATTLWDYINRAMPFDQPGYLTADEVYGAAAYVLYLNDIVEEGERLDETTLASVAMPNQNGFSEDPRR